MGMDTPRGGGMKVRPRHMLPHLFLTGRKPFSLVLGSPAEPSECLLLPRTRAEGGCLMYIWLPLRMWVTTREMRRGTKPLNNVSRHTKQTEYCILALPITLH